MTAESGYTAACVSAIVTAYQRVDQTIETIQRILDCVPPPREVLVHVDGNQQVCADAIRQRFPTIKVLVSTQNVGPGGGRNKLVVAAASEIVASFDDDSYPIDSDYFSGLIHLFMQFPDAALVCASVYERGQVVEPKAEELSWMADFSGGGCAYRKSLFQQTGGYVPLPIAYGMEEVDLALRWHAMGRKVLHSKALRVFHDSDLSRHASPRITAFSLANLALLAFLRYPVWLWPVGVGQIVNRVRWLLRNRRKDGVFSGLLAIPAHCWRHRGHRATVPGSVLRSYLALRRKPIPISAPTYRS